MSLVKKKDWYLDYLLIIVGTGLMALAINSVFDATGLVTGGFSGIAILVKHWTGEIIDGGVPLWLTNITLNIPLFFLGWRIKGFSFVKKALVGEISLSTWLAIQPVWNIAGDDLLLAAVYGGVILGIGIGMVFLGQGTTGGTDMMAALIQKYMRHYSIAQCLGCAFIYTSRIFAQIMQFIDGLIVIVGMYVFGIQRALYAIIAVYLVTKVSDSLIEGLKFSKQTFIVTEKPDEVARVIMEDLDRGATGICGKGMYSGQEKTIIFCVVNKKEIVKLKELVDDIDPNAFVIVSDAREVHGEGFIEKN